jgi:hypothetical protein
MKNTIKNKNGFLSAYGLACGYIEQKMNNNIEVTLYEEHGVYHVTAINRNYPTRKDCKIWETFDLLGEAKKEYFKLTRS